MVWAFGFLHTSPVSLASTVKYMRRTLRHFALLIAVPLGLLSAQQSPKPTIAQFMSPASALALASAKKADRIAWEVYEKGMRNVYAAGAPSWTPVRLTSFLKDDGVDITDVQLSEDGLIAIFVRGSAPNRDDWIANPSHDPDGGERAIWAAKTTGGSAWKLVDGSSPVLSPDGKSVLYVKSGQIYRARVNATAPLTEMDKGEKPFIKEWGTNSQPSWSPDGSKIAFVSTRTTHSLLGLYDVKSRTLTYVSPSVDFDANPTWSADGKRLLFTRRPGTPYGMQSQQGGGGIGFPQGPAYRGNTAGAAAAPGGGRGGRGGGGGGGGGFGAPVAAATGPNGGNLCASASAPAGLCSATFAGGYTLSVMVADMADPSQAKEVWHNKPQDKVITALSNLRWFGDNLVFPFTPVTDEFERWYAINLTNPNSDAFALTTTNGVIEDATSVAFSPDGKTLYYCTNANDIEKRHIWAVPTSGGTPRQVSTDDGIETYPQPLASGKQLAVLYFDAKTPASVGLVSAEGGKTKVIFPKLTKEFPSDAHVMPQIVMTKAADGMEIHNQLFLPADLKAGEKRPALIFVHGGPVRQMLPGYHYMQFYHWAYGFNQYLQTQGYIVLSINYRGGVGYGRAFRNAPGTNMRGNSEYQDVIAGAKYLLGRADVDTSRIGIWGLSYGGLLTSEALARNSDIFKAGADYAGVHLYTPTLDTSNVAYKSSAISAIDTWKSPVLLVHGDDDRNVDFAQTVGLVSLLRARNIYHELIVVPDDLHESMLHSMWIHTWERTVKFLDRFVKEKQLPPKAN